VTSRDPHALSPPRSLPSSRARQCPRPPR
jgi:hypothetical protein